VLTVQLGCWGREPGSRGAKRQRMPVPGLSQWREHGPGSLWCMSTLVGRRGACLPGWQRVPWKCWGMLCVRAWCEHRMPGRWRPPGGLALLLGVVVGELAPCCRSASGAGLLLSTGCLVWWGRRSGRHGAQLGGEPPLPGCRCSCYVPAPEKSYWYCCKELRELCGARSPQYAVYVLQARRAPSERCRGEHRCSWEAAAR